MEQTQFILSALYNDAPLKIGIGKLDLPDFEMPIIYTHEIPLQQCFNFNITITSTRGSKILKKPITCK